MKKTKTAMWLWLVCALSVLAVQAAEPITNTAAPVREPAQRLIDPDRDASAIERIERHRAKLPVQYRDRYNFAWAQAEIRGLDKTEYYAHSGIQSLDHFSSELAGQLAGLSVRPEEGRYETLCVNRDDEVDGPNCWQRTVDTEYKIIEDLAPRLPDTSVEGRVLLYTDLPPCASCRYVLRQFMAEYTNIRVQVLHKLQ